ncbi:hypothetical protein, partial [Staphylococcus aureus]|uniref:hypothetical protein n=1 Tax=Staphylococcus aureus TaxID=1280 RepID=UPI001A7E954C
YLLKLFVLSLLIIEVIALFLYSKSKNRTDENFSISPIYYRTLKIPIDFTFVGIFMVLLMLGIQIYDYQHMFSL